MNFSSYITTFFFEYGQIKFENTIFIWNNGLTLRLL